MHTWFGNTAPLSPEDIQTHHNQRSIIIDGIGVGIVAGIATFLSVFLARLGASPILVGLLTALPAFTGLLIAIPVGRFLERQHDLVPWYSWARISVHASYVCIGLLPFVIPRAHLPVAIIIIWAVATIPQIIVNITFTVVMSAVAGAHQRQQLMSWRWSTLGVAEALAVAGAGWLLERFVFPTNYQIIFIVSCLGGMLSFFFSSRIITPHNQNISPPHTLSPYTILSDSVTMFRAAPAFARFVLASFVFNCGISMAMPLFVLYWVHVVHASDFWIGIITTVNNAVLLIAYVVWARVTRKRGNRIVMFAATIALAMYPLCTGLTVSIPLLIIFAGLVGFIGAGKDLVFFDIGLDTMPNARISSFVAVQKCTEYIAALVMPLIGTGIAQRFTYQNALFVSSALCVGGVLLLYVLHVGKPVPLSAESR